MSDEIPSLDDYLNEKLDDPNTVNIGINNPYFSKRHLTITEAIDLINHVSMELLINERNRRHE